MSGVFYIGLGEKFDGGKVVETSSDAEHLYTAFVEY
jgi:hypothetical protein